MRYAQAGVFRQPHGEAGGEVDALRDSAEHGGAGSDKQGPRTSQSRLSMVDANVDRRVGQERHAHGIGLYRTQHRDPQVHYGRRRASRSVRMRIQPGVTQSPAATSWLSSKSPTRWRGQWSSSPTAIARIETVPSTPTARSRWSLRRWEC